MQLYNDDFFNVLPTLEPKSIDLVVVDLPYNCVSCDWDKDVIDLDKMWVELKRICKKKCIYIFFCNAKFGYTIIKSNPKWFKSDLIWVKNIKLGFLNCNRAVLKQHELIYLFGNNSGGKKTYNPQKIKKDKVYIHKGRNNADIYGNIKSVPMNNGGMYHPSTILKFNNPSKPVHTTQKPVDLCEWLIKSYSNEGDTVMDFTMGSGTTGVASKNLNRKFIGIEKDKAIFELALMRINYCNKDK